MMLKQLFVIFGDHLKLKRQSKISNQSSRIMALMWVVDGWNSLRNHILEVV
jgi:hypothetical protein